LNGLQVGRIKAFFTSHEFLLVLQANNLLSSPLRFSSLSHLALHLTLLLHRLDEDLFDLELDSAKLDNVVLL
jgi:hypothetical protein